MNYSLKYLGEGETYHPLIKIHVWEIRHNGSCQCNKDCNCANRKGELLGTQEKFSHPYAKYKDGNVKKFKNYIDCLKSLEAYEKALV